MEPSSDFTSWRVNGKEVKSSAMPSRELTGRNSALSDGPGCDHRAFRCSGTGSLDVDSRKGGTLKEGDFDQGNAWWPDVLNGDLSI